MTLLSHGIPGRAGGRLFLLLPALASLLAASAHAQTLSIEADPACGTPVSDLSLKPSHEMSLSPAPATRQETETALLGAGGERLTPWRAAGTAGTIASVGDPRGRDGRSAIIGPNFS